MAQVAAAAHAPFIAAAAPATMQMDSRGARAEESSTSPRSSRRRNMRLALNARLGRFDVGLAMPRFLSRMPYGAKTNPVEEFDFEEDTSGAKSEKYTWANAAYAMAVNINRAFKLYGWCSRIRGVESGGAVEGLPVHMFPSDDGGVDMNVRRRLQISDRRKWSGSRTVSCRSSTGKNSDVAASTWRSTAQQTAEYDDPMPTNAELKARAAPMFAWCQAAHYLKCTRDKIGSFKERGHAEMAVELDTEPRRRQSGELDEETKARKLLAAAEVVVEEVEGNPGEGDLEVLWPHYQPEGLTVSG